MVGGVAALIGTYLLGPRLARVQDDGSFRDLPPHSPPLATLGVILLVFG